MKVYLVQRPISWEAPQENFLAIEESLESEPPEQGALVVFAEMFSTGFSLALERVGEPEDGPSAGFLRRIATRFGVCTVGSFPHRDTAHSKGLNRLLAYLPDGAEALYYDKIHPFSYGKEAEHYTGGARLPLFRYQGWVICPSVCYDLRFPELYRRATLEGGAELFVCIANWPTPRREHWRTLLRARAIENQAVMVAVNRTGSDPHNSYSGDSAVIDAKGSPLLELGDAATIGACRIDKDELVRWRRTFPALADATDEFELLRPDAEQL